MNRERNDAAEYAAGWLAASLGQPCAFGMSAAWVAGFTDRAAPLRRRYLAGVTA
jgi:hypothetical protein